MMGSLASRYAEVTKVLPAHVKLIAVSKKRTVEEIRALYDLGHRRFGENYPQELRDKQPQLPHDIEWHFIGNLQPNKVKYVVPRASLVHTIDSERILDALNEQALKLGRRIPVLFQLHIAQEGTKHGFSYPEFKNLVARWRDRPGIVPSGLMGMATYTDDASVVRKEFKGLRLLFEELRSGGPFPRPNFTELSMGMSGDAEVAIEEGSTMVRIGTAIFGER